MLTTSNMKSRCKVKRVRFADGTLDKPERSSSVPNVRYNTSYLDHIRSVMNSLRTRQEKLILPIITPCPSSYTSPVIIDVCKD